MGCETRTREVDQPVARERAQRGLEANGLDVGEVRGELRGRRTRLEAREDATAQLTIRARVGRLGT